MFVNKIIKSIAGKSIKESVTESKVIKQSTIKQIEDDIRKLKKEQN